MKEIVQYWLSKESQNVVIKFEGGIAKGNAGVFKVDLSLDQVGVPVDTYLTKSSVGATYYRMEGELRLNVFLLIDIIFCVIIFINMKSFLT